MSKKCECVLIVLRAALFCGLSPLWLKGLSKEAVEWATRDLTLRSELVEASRLLLVDGIVRRYIGNEGCTMFRVDNPRHAINLLEFVCQHYHQASVLTDALDIADAFNHLSRLDAGTNICEQAILGGDIDICTTTCEKLYEIDAILADGVCTRLVAYCSELVAECADATGKDNVSVCRLDKLKQHALNASVTACTVISTAFAHTNSMTSESLSMNPYTKVDFASLEASKKHFQVIQYLQKEFSFFGLTLSDIRRGPQKLLKAGASLLEPVIKEYIQGDRKSWSVQLAKAKRASSLLADAGHCPEKEFWCALVATVTSPLKWPYDDGRCLDCLGDLGVLASFRDATAVSARTILSTAFSLCVKASSVAKRSREGFFNNFGRAVSLLQDYCLVCCPKNLLLQSQGLCTLAETVWHITLRGDEGSGERLESFRKILLEKCWTLRDPKTTLQSTNEETMPELPALCRPNLHASWYIGDGLLLPPSDSITRSVKFSKELMACLTSNTHKFGLGGISEIAKFLCSRGALSTALRLLLNSSVILLCSRVSGSTYDSIGETIQEVVTEGASRYVGGSGNGITSKIVDSEHAVCFLLSLPIKVAFKVYRSALPTAMKTRDYPRVLALANIGVVTGTGSPGSSVGKNLNVAWKKQDKFAQQCEQLGNKAYWWVFLKKHNIDFDSRRFDDDAKSGGTMNSAYAIYLITPIIAKMLLIKQYESAGDMVQDILDIVTRFAQTFGVKGEKVVECFVEYILSSPYSDCVENSDEDVRLHLPVVDLSVRSLLPTLQPIMRRAIALRRCVLNLEKDKNSGKDYDRHSLVLNLYRRTLYEISERDDIIRNVSSAILDAELEAIDRRCDALAILASVFEGERESDRPPFPDFFPPLPADITSASDYASLTANCSILGNSDGDGPFDPLKPLEEVLMRTYDMNTSMALAPLCFPLGLPNGYIHARFLMEHFRLASSQDSTMPSFDTDMRPVFSRIQSSGDKAMLAEWCSGFFKDNDQERLNCLELALNCAIKFSSEVEQRKNRYLDSKRKEPKTLELLEKEELTALETVQRLSQAKSSLSDKITVTKALLGATVVDNTVSKATEELLKRVSEALWKPQQEDCPAPEKVFEVLLSEASLLAATCSLGKTPFSIRQFQQMTSLCSEACQALADEHSHIHTAAIVDTMVRSWLFQGDDLGDEREPQSKKPLVGSSLSMKPSKTSSTFDDFEEEEEDTINFVMDLSAIQDPQDEEPLYCDEIERGGSISKKKMTSDEEPSALKKSSRESTEEMAKRVGLRVAFVMACDSLAQVPHSDEEKVAGDENCSLNANTNSVRSVGKKKAGGLLARIEKDGSKQNAYVLECARDLLQIVFAKSDIQCKSRIFAMPERTINQTVTFSMRHRALRAASILVPQDVLEKVIKEEGYLDETSTESLCSLKRCSFGIFVAKECEQIGMPLSHSDLGHISSMNFSSYARTLWRHFRDGDLKGSKGRLLLLLLEMSLKDTSEIDTAFVEVLLKEMGRLYLPRTIILACECIISLKGTKAYSSLLSTCPDTLNAAVVTSAKAILSEFHGLAKSESLPEEAPKEALLIVRRLGRVVQAFCDSDGGQSNLCHFIGVLASVCQGRSNDFLTKEIAGVISNSLRRVTCQEDRERLVTKIRGVQRLNDFCHFYDASL